MSGDAPMVAKITLDEQIEFVLNEETRAEVWADTTAGDIQAYHERRKIVAMRARQTLELVRLHEKDFVAMVTAKRQAEQRRNVR